MEPRAGRKNRLRAGELSVGPTVNGWSRLRLERPLDEENPAEIWVDPRRESIEEICAAIGAARTLSSRSGRPALLHGHPFR
jgi:hypothetical protein